MAHPARISIVAVLTVRRGELDTFRKYETQAARIMARHGGAIERAVVVPAGPGQPDSELTEVHVVTFPGPEAFESYRSDPELESLRPMRERSVLRTELLVGTEPELPYRS